MHLLAMHIPDGYLGPQTYVALWIVMIPIWIIAARKVNRTLKTRQIPLLALGAAFSFVIMMFNVPVVGGSTGHAVGATLMAIILGPWAAVIAVSIALFIQALLFGDGGITAIAANCFNMAVVMPFVGYYLYRLIGGDAPSSSRRVMSAGVASYAAIVVAAIVAGFEFGIQPYIAHTATGQALYAPYKLGVAVPAMALEHLLFFGWVEAIVTMGVVAVLARTEPDLLAMKPAAKSLRWLWAGIGALILLTPIGALAPGTAWGEWGGEELDELVGYVPANLEKLGGLWKAAMPDYATPGVSNTLLGYLVAAAVGVVLVAAVAWGVGSLLARRRGGPVPAADPPSPPPTSSAG
jgi:cobalt/nickel transport system permease protein